MNQLDMNPDELVSIFSVIGLSNPKGVQYRQRLHRHRQIFDFIVHIEKAVNQLSKKRTLSIVECASGRSYLSLIANQYLRNTVKQRVEFTCIDRNRHVMEQSIHAAEILGFDNMRFVFDDICNVKLDAAPDIIYSLHACDTATDMTIAKGISAQAKHIMTVSCCQHFVRSHMHKHPLAFMTRHSAYKERVADMVSDTMRGLVLEAMGYQIDLFEYVPVSETPKNIMLRAVKGPFSEKRSQRARDAYAKLKEIFHVEPWLMTYIDGEKRSGG